MRTTFKYLGSGHQVSNFRFPRATKSGRFTAIDQLRGFTLVELMIVVAIIGLLAAIALPHFARSRTTAQVNTCISNLKQLEQGKDEWALEFKKNNDTVPTTDDIIPYLRNDEIPECPARGTYRLRKVLLTPVCSLSPEGHTLDPGEDDSSE